MDASKQASFDFFFLNLHWLFFTYVVLFFCVKSWKFFCTFLHFSSCFFFLIFFFFFKVRATHTVLILVFLVVKKWLR